jgi:hypothetical protein
VSIRGIDVSHWQGTEPSHAGLEFEFARSTFGTQKDDQYEFHKAHALADGLVFGAYHFGDPSKSVAAQLAACLAATKGVTIVALDIEAGDMTTADAKVFLAGLKAAGKWAGLYHSASGFPWNLGQDFDWVARWGSTAPSGPWEFWQYRGSPLDLDYFNGTRAQLDALNGTGMVGGGNQPAGGAADMKFINSNGAALDTGLRLNVGKGSAWKYLDGSAGGTFSADAALVWVGKGDSKTGEHVVQIGTGAPYPADAVIRPTLVLVENTNQPYAAPVTPPTPPAADDTPFKQADIDAAVAAQKAQDQKDAAAAIAAAVQNERDRISGVLGI